MRIMKICKIFCLVLCFIGILAPPIAESGLKEGIAAAKNSSFKYTWSIYETAIRNLVPYAEKGNLKAKYYLGVVLGTDTHYYNKSPIIINGVTYKRDVVKSLELVTEAANGGLVEAENQLGWIYLNFVDTSFLYKFGNGDFEKAYWWFKKAAKKGFLDSQIALGQLLSFKSTMLEDKFGRKFRFDEKEGFYWLQIAAEKIKKKMKYFSWPKSTVLSDLGYIYFKGNSATPQSYTKARKWYEMAANFKHKKDVSHSNKCAEYQLSVIYYKGLGVRKNYRKSFSYLIRDYNRLKKGGFGVNPFDTGIYNGPYGYCETIGDTVSNQLGYRFLHGIGTSQNEYMAFYWFAKGIRSGYEDSIKKDFFGFKTSAAYRRIMLGRRYLDGKYYYPTPTGYSVEGNHIQSNVLAHIWFNIASMDGGDVARKYRGIAEKKMSQKEIIIAQKVALEWARQVGKLRGR